MCDNPGSHKEGDPQPATASSLEPSLDGPSESVSVNDHVYAESAGAENGNSRTDVSATRQCTSHYDSTTRTARQLTLPVPTRTYDMAEQRKQEKDYTKEVDELLPETRSLAQVRALQHDARMLLTASVQVRLASCRMLWTSSLRLRNRQEMCALYISVSSPVLDYLLFRPRTLRQRLVS